MEPDTYDYYDTSLFGERLRKMRETRKAEYLDYMKFVKGTKDEPKVRSKEKYKCCENQTAFADKLGISRQTVNSWENGRIPPLDQLIMICGILDCSIDYLLGGVESELFGPIKVAHYFSGIKASIIEHCRSNPNYLDFLNYMMNPDKCQSMINTIEIINWRDYNSSIQIRDINNPLKDIIIQNYNYFISTTPIGKINIDSFRSSFNAMPQINTEIIKDSLSAKLFETFLNSNGSFSYSKFTQYIANETFEPLRNYTNLETQKSILSKSFSDSLQQYIENPDEI